jgi:predicted permease
MQIDSIDIQILLDIINIVFPVFLVIALGYIFRRMNLFGTEFLQNSNKLIFNVTLPLLMFYKIATSDFSTNFNGMMIVGGWLSIFLCCVFAYGFAYIRKFPADEIGVFTQGSFRGNLAIIGLAIVFNAYGSVGLTRGAILMGFVVPILNLFAVIVLLLPHHDSNTFKLTKWIKQIFTNPLIIASMIAIPWSFFRVPMPTLADRTLQIITNLTLPLSLLAVGGGLSIRKFKGDFVKASLAASFKLILHPILTFVILYLLGISGQDLAIGVLMIGSPTAIVSYVMASQMKGNPELAGSIVVLATLGSIISYSMVLLAFKLLGI